MNHERAITKLFDYFYNKTYKTNFKLDLSKNNQQKLVDNFIKILAVYYPSLDGISFNFLIEYFSFSFFCYSDKKLKRKISLGWIIGKKMFTRFFEQKDGHKYYLNKWLWENNINIDDLRSQLIEQQQVEDKLDPAEELEKLRMHGDARLYNCLLNTTLYNHRSVNCLGCENKILCKALLKRERPQLYRKRGYV